MKILINFFVIYLITIGLIVTVYTHIRSDIQNQFNITENEIHGVTYLEALHKLGVSIATYNGEITFHQHNENLQSQIVENIDALYTLQKKHPQYIDKEFNNKLEKIKQFQMDYKDYYEFLNTLGFENYRIGDISQLLFEKDRKIYFLSSLLTHYMPEYIISILVSHNIVEELAQTGTINSFKNYIFIEQTKLLYLSSEEIATIIEQLHTYEDTKVLSLYIKSILKSLDDLSTKIEYKSLQKQSQENIQAYLTTTHNILNDSYALNDSLVKIIKQNLFERKNYLEEQLMYANAISSIIFLLLTLLFIYSFRLFRATQQQHEALLVEKEKTQKALEFKSKFLSNMSHEIRTPLNAIIGLTELSLKTELSPKQQDFMDKINASGKLLLGVINDILDISKIESGKMQIEKHTFNLKKCVENVQSMFISQAEAKGLEIVIHYKDIENFQRVGDSLRISQILTNLVSNAIKFTSKGLIEISVIGINERDVRFEVKDNGIGLKPEQIDSLFEDFTQADMDTSRKYGGTGLGLSISKNLTQMMGGEIFVESEYSKGSTFIFTLPLEVDREEEKSEQKVERSLDELEEELNLLKNTKILIAEDNKMNQSLLEMLLEDTSLQLTFADDGAIAVEMASKEDFDLILMDIQMPNMNGFEATELIRQKDKLIPIIALSANVMQEDIQKCLDAGMNAHLAKPIDTKKLYLTLLQFLCN